MAVERGQRRTVCDHLIHARAARHDAGELLAAGNHHLPSAPLDQPRVADELDRVTQPLLGMQKDRSTLERSAVPDGLIERAYSTRLAPRAPFVLIPTSLEVAHLQPGHGPVQVGLGEVGREAKRLVVALHGFGKPPLGLKHQAEVVVGAGVVGLVMQGAKVAGSRFIEHPLRLECVAQIVMCLRIARLEPEGLPEARRGFVGPAQDWSETPRLFQVSAFEGIRLSELR